MPTKKLTKIYEIDTKRIDKLELLLTRLREWQTDPSNIKWTPIREIIKDLDNDTEIKEQGK
jgi:hypothetical protein